MDPARRASLEAWAILALLAVIWGTSFILIKRGLEVFSSDEVGALRISIAFIVLSPMAIQRIRRPTSREWKLLVVVGLIGSGIPAFLFAKAQTGIDSSLAGILNSLTPLFTIIIGMAFFTLRTRWFNLAGVLIGLGGAIGLISISGQGNFEFNFGYALYVIIATICYATNVNIIKYKLRELDPLTITAFSFFTIGSPVVLYLFFLTDFPVQMLHDPLAWQGLGYVAILSVVGTAMALILFNKMVKIASPVFAASVTYLIPAVAVSWGMVDGEPFGWQHIAWMLMILAGVFLVNKKTLSLKGKRTGSD